MKRFAIVLALNLAAGAAYPADLLAVYQRALQNDPQLREAEATRLAALEAKPQALSALLPQLAGNGQISRERDTGTQNQTESLQLPPCSASLPAGEPCAPPGTPTTVFESFPFSGKTDTTIHHYTIDLKQSLFRWENWQALKRADSQVAQAEADYQAAQQDLMERVAQRYFDVLGAQDDLEAQQVALTSVTRQLAQAEARYQIGLIAVTDVEEARASHDSTAAAVIAAKRALASTQELLREIIGDPFDSLARPIEPFEMANPDPISENRWVEMALQQNLSLVSSRLAADIARENVSVARGGHFPSLDLVGSAGKLTNNGVDVFDDGTPAGGTTLDQRQRSIGIQLTFPIYSGGMVSSQVRQAVYQHRAAKERLERVARQTEHDARDAYLGVLSEISRVKALHRAVESNLTALRATESGYEAGTRTAVDVLQSRQQWVQAQTDYSRSRYDYMLNVIKLQQAAGTLSEQSLQRINGLLTDTPAPMPKDDAPAAKVQ
ncbi:MAG TPA: TolC family outer membrane protein [Steroidobacteraceae bacterium]|jgi:outer membrane protein|nr:TolC family outer membrane protein [Steroidobacteraceae bacterium]